MSGGDAIGERSCRPAVAMLAGAPRKKWAVRLHGPSLGRKRLEDVRQSPSGDEPCRTAQYASPWTKNQPQNRICEKKRKAWQSATKPPFFGHQWCDAQ
jgi:hypothetical protein